MRYAYYTNSKSVEPLIKRFIDKSQEENFVFRGLKPQMIANVLYCKVNCITSRKDLNMLYTVSLQPPECVFHFVA